MTGIVSRRGAWYYRQRIPVDLLPHFAQRNIRRSLHTSDEKTARAIGSNLAAKVRQAFALLRTGA